MNNPHRGVPAQYVDESSADYEARVEDERLRQEQFDADPEAQVAWVNDAAKHLHETSVADDLRRQAEEHQFEAVIGDGDFIGSYSRWAHTTKFPQTVHEAIAIGLIAAITNLRGVTIDRGAFTLTMDFWMNILAPPSGGKDTSMRPLRNLLKRCGIGNLIDREDWDSKESLYALFGEQEDQDQFNQQRSHAHLYCWTELGEILTKLNDPKFEGAKIWLSKLYDSTEPPNDKILKTKGLSVKFNHAPRTNFLGFSSEEWYRTQMKAADMGGFFQRWFYVNTLDGWRTMPEAEAPNKMAEIALAEILTARILSIPEGGRATFFPGFSEVDETGTSTAPYNVWFHEAQRRWREADPINGDPAFGRHAQMILKLAVCYQLSMNGSLKVTPAAWERAVSYARKSEDMVFKVFGTGLTKEEYERSANQKKIAEAIRITKEKGISQRDLGRKFQSMDRRVYALILDTLLKNEIIYLEERQTPGRTAKFYIHEDYCKHLPVEVVGDAAQE